MEMFGYIIELNALNIFTFILFVLLCLLSIPMLGIMLEATKQNTFASKHKK